MTRQARRGMKHRLLEITIATGFAAIVMWAAQAWAQEQSDRGPAVVVHINEIYYVVVILISIVTASWRVFSKVGKIKAEIEGKSVESLEKESRRIDDKFANVYSRLSAQGTDCGTCKLQQFKDHADIIRMHDKDIAQVRREIQDLNLTHVEAQGNMDVLVEKLDNLLEKVDTMAKAQEIMNEKLATDTAEVASMKGVLDNLMASRERSPRA